MDSCGNRAKPASLLTIIIHHPNGCFSKVSSFKQPLKPLKPLSSSPTITTVRHFQSILSLLIACTLATSPRTSTPFFPPAVDRLQSSPFCLQPKFRPARGQGSAAMGFGDFSSICQKNAFPLCSLVGSGNGINRDTGIQPNCYARSVEFANTIIFEAATDFMHMLALGMAVIMVLHVRSKFTAVGRKEITTFFYIYMLLTMTSLVLDSGVIPPGSGAYPYFAAAQNGLTSALCTCLLVNGFVGFQLYEDGTTQSVWLLRGSSIGMFILSGGISLMTFKSWGLAPTNTLGLFVVLYLINAIFLLVYVVSQVILVTATLQDRWPLGHIGFGVFFFIIGQVILYVFGSTICNAAQHYLDGLFFATVCNLLAVMMVYKYWDSITKEDLEFSVGTKQGNWEVKELLPEEDRRATVYQDGTSEYASSMYHQATPRTSNYGGYST
ncbi:MAG: hypothetical protein Q9178_005884 [Gyalolechia marmorata]